VATDVDQRQVPAVARVGPVLAGCLLLGALSLVLVPSTITFDPLTWATWAREIVHLDLDTTGGPAWKPLPVMVDVVFAPFGALAKWVWLAVARAGVALAAAMAYRLARRLAGPAAGLIAAGGFLLSASLLEYLAPLGMSEPLLAGLALLAIERHLDGHYGQAYGLIYACLLLRPETFPFFLGYSAFLWFRSLRARPWAVLLAALLPVWWLLPDYLATGNALRSSERAALPTQGGPLLTSFPAWAVVESAFNAVALPVVVGAVIAMVLSGVAYARRRDDPVLVGLSLGCLGWLVVVAVETQAHLGSGDQRYLIVSYSLACVLAGIGWVRAVRLAASWLLARRRSPAAAPTIARSATAALAVVVILASGPFVASRIDELTGNIGEVPYQAHKYGELAALIRQVGGRRPILACGPVTSDIYQMPALAWDLDVHQSRIVIATATDNLPASGTVFRSRTTRGSPVVPPTPGSPGFRVVAATAQWQLLSTCDDLHR